MNEETVKLTIDGQPVEVQKGKTILQAAEQAGIHIPRYCYHPGLDIVGSCRICQVELEGMPSPVIACHTRVQEGHRVLTDSPLVRRVRSAVLEFLLLNHPIDCPICDTSGECDLQNYYMTDGRHKSRLRHHKMNREKRKRLGAQVVLDQERCILCSRCVRFFQNITQTHELGFLGKGDGSYIDLVGEKTLKDNLNAGNVIHLCPVGALTDDDFRFKCRVWYLSIAPSLCPHCANGCNIDIHFNTELCWKNDGKRIMRIKPRFNPHVNGYWMCDIGRYNYDFAEDATRIQRSFLEQGGERTSITWEEALGIAAERIGVRENTKTSNSIALVPSTWMTNEAVYLFRRLFIDGLGARTIGLRSGQGEEEGDGILLRNDRCPNRLGLELILFDGRDGGQRRDEVLRQAAEGRFRSLVYVQGPPDGMPPEELLDAAAKGADFVLVLASNTSPVTERADLVLPTSPWSEENGTWINWRRRLQWLTPALPPLGYSRNTTEVLALLSTHFGIDLGDGKPAATFDAMAREIRSFTGLSYDDLKESGKDI
jgi:NADH-quinone oxidoreductase subunit G